LFRRGTLQDPNYPVSLDELSLSFDQRAIPHGVTGDVSASAPGLPTACDMSRYDMTLRLLERQPWVLTGDTTSSRTILEVEFSGPLLFGNEFQTDNPLVLTNLGIFIKPFSVYVWELYCPGLFSEDGTNIWTATVGAGYAPADTFDLTIGPTVYPYVVPAGPPAPAVVAADIAALAAADPNYAVTSDGATITLRGLNGSGSVSVSVAHLGGGTFTLVHLDIPTVEQLALVSLNLSAVFTSPLIERDKTDDFPPPAPDPNWPGVQNIPTKHDGDKAGTTIPVTTPGGNAVISGTDIQNNLHGFDEALRRRAPSGYGVDAGALGNPMQAADRAPSELLFNDAHYMMIAVPMWSGQNQNSVRSVDVVRAGLPYADNLIMPPPFTEPIYDQRVIPVPQNFVLHHCFAVWNNYSPPALESAGRGTVGLRSTQADYIQKVGVAIASGLRSDNYAGQMVAFIEFNGVNATTFALDIYEPEAPGTTLVVPRYVLLNMPLVQEAPGWSGQTWQKSGLPFFMGRANSSTEERTNTGILPADFGNGFFGTPATAGQENVLVVAWSKKEAVSGLDDPAHPRDVRIGQGGEWVILCGKVTVGG